MKYKLPVHTRNLKVTLSYQILFKGCVSVLRAAQLSFDNILVQNTVVKVESCAK